MREVLNCRELLGHEDYPELLREEEETNFTTLADPLPFYYSVLTEKHLDEQMRLGALVGISKHRATVEVAGRLTQYANIMLRLEIASGEEESPELYAKVIRPLEESDKRYLIHFTSVPPAVQARLARLANRVKSS